MGGPELLFIFFLLPLVLCIIALISCLTANFKEPVNKLIWVLVILFLPLIGSILYFTISKSQRVA